MQRSLVFFKDYFLFVLSVRYPRIRHSNADNLDNLTHRASMCLSINKFWSRLTPNSLSLFSATNVKNMHPHRDSNESITSPSIVKSRELGKNLRFYMLMKMPNMGHSFVYFRHSSVPGVKWRPLTAV